MLYRLVLCCLLWSCASETRADDAKEDETNASKAISGALVAEQYLALPAPIRELLLQKRYTKALDALKEWDASLSGKQEADRAFLIAWCAIHTDEPKVGAPFLSASQSSRAPLEYRALVAGELLVASNKPLEALTPLASIGVDHLLYSRAALGRAAALRGLGRTKEAGEVYEEMVSRPDPAAGSDQALLALVKIRGEKNPDSLALLKQIFTYYPRTEGDEAAKLAVSERRLKVGRKERTLRAEKLMYQGAYDEAISLTLIDRDRPTDDVDACRLRYVRGRSFYKKNQVSNSILGFKDAGEKCANLDSGYGARSLYLKGTAQYRRKQFSSSAATYRLLADKYSDHSMADDALTRGGISLQEAGKLDEAQKWWREALEEYPDGDTVPEASWRLAFSLYLKGKPSEAIVVAERLSKLPRTSEGAIHVEAGRYWSARWRAYPSVARPNQLTTDLKKRKAAIAGWRSLCEDLPHSYYSILAHARLVELAPDVAKKVSRRSERHDTGREPNKKPWPVTAPFEEKTTSALALSRVGLPNEANAEMAATGLSRTPPEEAFWIVQRGLAGDWLMAHDHGRRYIREHPLGELGPEEPRILRVLYPDRYFAEVKEAMKSDYLMSARLFHGLVREESNFNRKIVSFAGARGLSQLMPATARQTAGWLGMKITMDDLFEPTTNLPIGARYLHQMHKQLSSSPYLSLAAYNGGAGNVKKWIGEYGNLPTDEYVERIPFRETRGYVKRVSGTWQTYRYRFDVDVPIFQDLSRFNHKALP